MRIINKILKPFNVQVNKISSLAIEQFDQDNITAFFKAFGEHYYQASFNTLNKDISGIVFSKNRAMQLHALLASYFNYTQNPAPLTILFTCTSPEHEDSYQRLQDIFKTYPVHFIREADFAFQLKETVNKISAGRIFFMTDDAVFLDHYDLSDCLNFDPYENVFSLRLGRDVDFCYTHNKKQSVPHFKETDKAGRQFNSWTWKDMTDSPDWSYPLSVDATIFLKAEIDIILNRIRFKSPNSLEAAMQQYSKIFVAKKGVCFSKAKYTNVPCNVVQQEFRNLYTGDYSVEELLTRFLDGERIVWEKLGNLPVPEAQVAKFTFTHR